MEDVLAEIFLRLPPDEPACLFRASLVCKTWLRVISDADFPRRYRQRHGAPPVLCYLHNKEHSSSTPTHVTRRLIPTTKASPFSSPATPFSPRGWAFDARHGRVLLQSYGWIVVWDPVTGEEHHVPFPEHPLYCDAGAVLCAARGCDHLDCHGGPFLVVAVGLDGDGEVASGGVYSSDTGAWGASTSIQIDSHGRDVINMRPSLLAGDAVYFMCFSGMAILGYDMGRHELSAFDPPLDPKVGHCQGVLITTAEDGALGFAGLDGSTIYVWSRQVSPAGVVEWVRRMAIDLDTLFPTGCGSQADLVAFAEGTDTVFVAMNEGVFAVGLKSRRINKVGDDAGGCHAIVPYTSFYTPDYGKRRSAPPGSMMQ